MLLFSSFSVLSLKIASTQFSLMLNIPRISASSLHYTEACIWVLSYNLQNLHCLSLYAFLKFPLIASIWDLTLNIIFTTSSLFSDK